MADWMKAPFKSASWRSGVLTMVDNLGWETTYDMTVSEAKAFVEEFIDDWAEARWTAASEAAMEEAANRFWEEGSASFQMMRAAEQQWEDERTGYWEMKDRERINV